MLLLGSKYSESGSHIISDMIKGVTLQRPSYFHELMAVHRDQDMNKVGGGPCYKQLRKLMWVMQANIDKAWSLFLLRTSLVIFLVCEFFISFNTVMEGGTFLIQEITDWG